MQYIYSCKTNKEMCKSKHKYDKIFKIWRAENLWQHVGTVHAVTQNSPTHLPKSSVPTTPISPTKPHRNGIWGVLPDKRRVPMVGQLVLEDSHPG